MPRSKDKIKPVPAVAVASDAPEPNSKFRFTDIFQRVNRGLLLDIVVFLFNLLLVRFVIKLSVDLINQASAGDFFAQLTLLLFGIGLFVLPPIGATLKRWHYQQRRQNKINEKAGEDYLGGCLFNPILYFCLIVVIYCAVTASIEQFFFGDDEPASVFIPVLLGGIVLMILNTYLVYRYFIPPKHPPRSEFMLDYRSELIGDICIFINMLLFQVIWNLLFGKYMSFGHPTSVSDFLSRFFLLAFAGLLIYFPPRMFYLAEDIHRRRTWIMILLANSPVIFRVVIGSSNSSGW